jgi:hypothetical protein
MLRSASGARASTPRAQQRVCLRRGILPEVSDALLQLSKHQVTAVVSHANPRGLTGACEMLP